MSFFVYMAMELENEAERVRLVELLEQLELSPGRRYFSEQYSAEVLYGFEPRQGSLFELEFSPEPDLETKLLDFGDEERKWRHYQDIARQLGRRVSALGEDEIVNAAFLSSPLELSVVKMLRQIANDFAQRPVVMVLDPEFSIRFGRLTELRGFDEIVRGTWRAAAMRDLEEPLRLVVTN